MLGGLEAGLSGLIRYGRRPWLVAFGCSGAVGRLHAWQTREWLPRSLGRGAYTGTVLLQQVH